MPETCILGIDSFNAVTPPSALRRTVWVVVSINALTIYDAIDKLVLTKVSGAGGESAYIKVANDNAAAIAAYKRGHILVVERVASDARIRALITQLSGEQLPGCSDFWLPPPGRPASRPPFGFIAAWQALAVSI